MNKFNALLLASAMLLGVTNALAQSQPAANAPPGSQPAARVRGVITAFDGNSLEVHTREGNMLHLNVPDSAKINVLSPLKMSDIKQGSFIGVTAVLRGPGPTREAVEVHVFPESMRGTGEGHYDWDLQPGSTMTNANVDAMVVTKRGKELTLGYKGGSQKIIVPPHVPVVTFTPADKSLLKAGAPVFIIAQHEADGSLTALRVLVGRHGLKPPM